MVRTDQNAPKHKGISFLLVDMKSKGVSTRPIKLISGKSPFCETFFDAVRVPKSNLVGNLNDGWTIAKFLLTHERQMIGGIGETDIKQSPHNLAKKNLPFENGKLKDSILRTEISDFELDDEIFNLTIQRIIDEAKAGNNSGALSSFFKYYGTELNVKRFELLLSISGSDGLLWLDEKDSGINLARNFCRSKGNTIEGGTSEIQLNIIAKRILELP